MLEELRTYFGQFGALADCRMKEDKLTNKFRGFAFIRYEDPRVRDYVLQKKGHTFKGVKLDIKAAVTREANEEKVNDEQQRKVFLAQINHKLSECKLL